MESMHDITTLKRNSCVRVQFFNKTCECIDDNLNTGNGQGIHYFPVLLFSILFVSEIR